MPIPFRAHEHILPYGLAKLNTIDGPHSFRRRFEIMFKKLAIRVGLSVLGTAAVLAWWTIHPGTSHTKTANRIPTLIWGGGPTKITVEVESSSAAHMDITFSDHSKPAGEQPTLETREMMAAGA